MHTSAQAWAKATTQGSIYFQDATLSKLACNDAITAAHVLGQLLSPPLAAPPSMHAHARALVLLLLHHDGGVRRAASAVARARVAASTSPLLFDAMEHWQARAADAAVLLAAPQDVAGEGPVGGPALGALAPRMAVALVTVAPPAFDAPLLARLMLAAHHPSVAAGQGGSLVAWAALRRALGVEAVAGVLAGMCGVCS